MIAALSAVLTVALIATPARAPQADAPGDPDRLYGSVTTVDGERFEGFIRWDENEGGWSDILHGTKDLPEQNYRDALRLTDGDFERSSNSVKFLGLRISWDDEEDYPEEASSGIRFGHVRSLEVLDDRRALLVLSNGEEIELRGAGSDLGRGNRGVVVEDPEAGAIELEWRDIETVDFFPAPAGAESLDGERLFGTVWTRWGGEFRGHVAWDNDEILTVDILDGRERGRKREIAFGEIESIERRGSSSARVTLRNGDELVLDDSNDVDDDNRGIVVSDRGLGEVTVGWDDFDRIVFESAPEGSPELGPVGPLSGDVRTERGEVYSGSIRWDNDEEATWEMLNGEYRDTEFEIEFSNVATIEKLSDDEVLVTLRDGREVELEGSNDVDDDNKGIFIREGEDLRLVEWRDFREVSFVAPGR